MKKFAVFMSTLSLLCGSFSVANDSAFVKSLEDKADNFAEKAEKLEKGKLANGKLNLSTPKTTLPYYISADSNGLSQRPISQVMRPEAVPQIKVGGQPVETATTQASEIMAKLRGTPIAPKGENDWDLSLRSRAVTKGVIDSNGLKLRAGASNKGGFGPAVRGKTCWPLCNGEEGNSTH